MTLSIEDICNYFGDRGVYFWPESSMFSKIEEQVELMKKCFDILDWTDDLIFFRFKENPEQYGMIDNVGIYDGSDLKSINVINISYTKDSDHSSDEESEAIFDQDVIEIWCSIPEDLYKKINGIPQAKELIESFLEEK